ncbi:hypothetical protein N0B51_01130 [Tsuneonella sp. YG55]|uniref:Uncharacterized protein n=1 Tax=Tsuneonella litorea TaxID=2976475 RepID=A0A9X2W0E0_9SPHN|nr:hypothetical protein [Tsuneonella litorea]MCT2557575.1 hypothetical protein [Tsuneonella litorea]
MTRTASNLMAIVAAVVLTVVTFQQTVVVPGSPAPIAAAQLA